MDKPWSLSGQRSEEQPAWCSGADAARRRFRVVGSGPRSPGRRGRRARRQACHSSLNGI